ncbi:MAG: inositol monophosphatase family protein [Arenicella sp.]
MHAILNIAVKAARDAANIINRYAPDVDRLEVTQKSATQKVSEVDLLANEAIIQEIKKNYPSHNIVSEEGSSKSNTPDAEYTWIIDPLDGTNNFLHGFPYYCISIAIQREGETQYAVIIDPARQDVFTATKGGGAQLNDSRIRVSNTKRLSDALLSTGMPFRDPAEIKPWLKSYAALLPRANSIVRCGASALDLAYVAAGRYDGLWQFGLKSWDISAGALLIQESGGLISDINGKQGFLDSGDIVCGNPAIHAKLQQLVHIHAQ